MLTVKYQVRHEDSRLFLATNSLKALTEFWNSPFGQTLTIIQEFGRKGIHLTYIVMELK